MLKMLNEKKKLFNDSLTMLLVAFLVSCTSHIEVDRNDNAPVSSNLSPSDGYRDLETTITLSYTDADSDFATSCSISGLLNLTETAACACSSGTCTVGVTGAASYTGAVSFNYTVTAKSAISNQASASFTINAIGASSTDEWVRIPANSGGIGLAEFYVMKYEAKAWNDSNTNSSIDSGEVDSDGTGIATGSHIPVSITDNQPWRSINANNSAAECESLGANYHLISNPEWMAIARNIEVQPENWTGSSVGIGCLFTGNGPNTTCGYNSATDPDSGSTRNSRARYLLSNGSYIYDFAGNAVEWVDWDEATVGFQKTPQSCQINWTNLPAVSCIDFVDSDYNSLNGSYDFNQGVGQMLLRSDPNNGALARGGSYTSGSNDIGIYSFNNFPDSTYSDSDISFRCVYRP